jgi:predicted dinucleotide-binding enzyme
VRNTATLVGQTVVDISKPLNTTFGGALVSGAVDGHALDVFVASSDDAVKGTELRFVNDFRLHGIVAGKLERARQLEGLALLGITLRMPLGLGLQSAWKLVAQLRALAARCPLAAAACRTM